MQYTFIHSNIRIVMCRIRSGKCGHFVLHKNGWLFASWGDLQSAVWPWGRVTLVVAKIGWLTTYNPASRVINKKKHIHVSWFKSCLKIAWYAYFRVSLIWFKTTLLIRVTKLQAEITPNYAGIWWYNSAGLPQTEQTLDMVAPLHHVCLSPIDSAWEASAQTELWRCKS